MKRSTALLFINICDEPLMLHPNPACGRHGPTSSPPLTIHKHKQQLWVCHGVHAVSAAPELYSDQSHTSHAPHHTHVPFSRVLPLERAWCLSFALPEANCSLIALKQALARDERKPQKNPQDRLPHCQHLLLF